MADGKMKKPKTKKQKKFFANLGKGDTPAQAAKRAGYRPGINPQEIISNHSDYWNEKLNAAGCTDDLICQTIVEGLKATKVVGYLQGVNADKDGQLHKVKPDLTVSNEFVEVADYPTRAKFVDIALKLKNAYPNDKKPFGDNVKEVSIVYG